MSKTAVILILPQAFIGCVAQNPVAGPAAQLDLGNERRLREDQVLAFERQDRGFCPEFVEGRLRYAESFSLNPVPTEPTETQAEPPRPAKEQASDAAARQFALLATDDHEALTLHALNFRQSPLRPER